MRRELKDVGCCDFFISSNLMAVFLDRFLHFWGVYAIESPLGLLILFSGNDVCILHNSKLHLSSVHRAMWAPPPTWTFSEASMP